MNSLLDRITALNVATEFLVPHITGGSQAAVVQWLKADLAALEQLRKQMKRDQREAPPSPVSGSALAAIIDAKYVALGQLDAKKKRAGANTNANGKTSANGKPRAPRRSARASPPKTAVSKTT